MNLSLDELNILHYCVSKVRLLDIKLIDNDKLDELKDKLIDEIDKMIIDKEINRK